MASLKNREAILFVATLHFRKLGEMIIKPMKHLLLPFLSLSLLLFACEPTTLNTEPNISLPLVSMNYDGPVRTAPITSGGTYEAAVRFLAADLTLSGFVDKPLQQVYYYLLEKPSSSTIKVYFGSNGDEPDELVYSASTSSESAGESWNQHIINVPLTIPANTDLWISLKYSSTNPSRIVGCDEGPAHPEGSWMYQSSDDLFERFVERTNGEANINWSIRGVIDPS